MIKIITLTNLLVLFHWSLAIAQTGRVEGTIEGEGIEKLIGAVVIAQSLTDTAAQWTTLTDEKGNYQLENLPYDNYVLKSSYLGYNPNQQNFHIDRQHNAQIIRLQLESSILQTDQLVVTGTKTFKRQTQSPVIVNVIDNATLNNVQACNLSDGLKFQPGLRVETDCQTCNYTQIRMNGLAGGYSQVLINGRPIFSPLTGLYGLEQIPTNMVERIEVVRGGGSALYGSSAVGGTVNVITKIPKKNSYTIGYTYQNINAQSSDHIFSGNATVVTPQGNAGASFFVNNRNRQAYDHNGDNFSELPSLRNNALGANLFILPTPNQKLEANISYLNEYRYGGELVDKPAHLAQQSEERTHDVLLGSLDYQINFNDDNSTLIVYAAGQTTTRKHYTGIIPDDSLGFLQHLETPPYGTSDVLTVQGGTQVNHRLAKFLTGTNVLTAGAEFTYDKVNDEIEPYRYLIDQTTSNVGFFVQSDWQVVKNLTLLTGVRADKHNLVSNFIFSPRVSLLYQPKPTTQLRLTWGTGFRAPQAFDADLHIAFAGGGVSRIMLSPDLRPERSNSLSGSVNYDKATAKYVFGFTIEGFYTHLNHAFYQFPLGEDDLGEVFEKRNGQGATVAGATLELRANYDRKIQLELGYTQQMSRYDSPIEYSDVLPARKDFLRTPNNYGFATLLYTPTANFSTNLNLVYTGSMDLVHLAGAPEQTQDAYITTASFVELNWKIGYLFKLQQTGLGIEVFGGIKNIFNAYQQDFDSGKERDSNYIYGPATPRTFFVGIKMQSL